jgi:hypothetical protein
MASYTLIKFPIDFGDGPIPKFFVVLSHSQTHAYCLKATASTQFYDNNPRAMRGCIEYNPGTYPHFRKRTLIETSNTFEIKH